MHNKFAIFDSKLIVTGSYNWTNNAEWFNYENAVFITDPNVIRQHQKYFDNIWQNAPNVGNRRCDWRPPAACPKCGSTDTRFVGPHHEMSIYECNVCGCRFEAE